MTRATIRRSVVWLLALAAFLALPLAAAGSEEADSSADAEAPEQRIQQEVDEKLVERRKALMEEAHSALDETNAALEALDAGKTKEAIDALARATGKLELIVARDPDLALAPVDVALVTHDLYATPESITKARDEAKDLLRQGKVQEARRLLSGLASEIVIRVTNLPLATYPDAIKEVTPLIDEGKTEDAKAALRAALSTLVVTSHAISLPVVRAQAALDEAEKLLEKEEMLEGDTEKISAQIKNAREQLEMAELLGYAEKEELKEFREQIAELERKIGAGEETTGVFAKLRKSLEGFRVSFFE